MMRPWFIRVFSVLVFCLFSGQSLAGPQAADGDMVSLNFQDVTIRTVISTVSKLTGRNFVVDPAVRGKVTVIAAHPVRRDEVYPLFLSLLKVYRLAVVEGDQIAQIIPMDRARSSGQPLFDGGEAAGAFVTRLIRLKYIQADRLISVLRPLVPPKAYLAAVPDSNMLIISDRAANCRRIAAIVTELDQARSGNFEIITLKYADAADLARVVQNLDDAARGKKGDIRVIADERTNSLIVAGPDFRLLQVKAIAKNLDTPVKEEGSTQVVYLKYARAKDLVKVLSEVPLAGKTGGKQPTRKLSPRTGRVSIVADENTNALVITAPPAVMRDLRRVISRLDIRRPQVLIEAIIAEVTLSDAEKLGIQWSVLHNVNIEGNTYKGLAQGSSGLEDLPSLAAQTFPPALGAAPDGGISYILFRSNKLMSMVNALASESKVKILSSPRLLVRDQEEASIEVGSDIPTATSTTQTTTTDTLTQNIEYRTVGIKLKIKPTISEDKTVVLDIEQEVSSKGESQQVGQSGNLFPTFTTTKAKTSIVVPDKQGILIGGIMQEKKDRSYQGIPLLSKIPILGPIFRYRVNSIVKKELVIIINPHVVSTRDEADVLTRTYMEKLRAVREFLQEKQGSINYSPDGVSGKQVNEP